MKITTIPRRPTLASARASKHIEQAKDAARMVRFYNDIGDEKSAAHWRKILDEKIADAKNITDAVWRAHG